MTLRFTPPEFDYSSNSAAVFAGSAFGTFSPVQSNGPFRVSYDLYLGEFGQYCTNLILRTCLADLNSLGQFFSLAPPPNFAVDVQLTVRTDGASHPTCLSTQISVGALTANGSAPLVRALMIAELAEVFMAAKNNGWQCDFSHGEGLSRVMAEEICPGAIPTALCSAPIWLQSPRVDYVNSTYHSDRQLEPVGCAVLFLYWMHYQQNIPWQQIIAAGGDTLAETYSRITGDNNGYAEFRQTLDSRYPPGTTSQYDNVFPLGSAAFATEIASIPQPPSAPLSQPALTSPAQWMAIPNETSGKRSASKKSSPAPRKKTRSRKPPAKRK